MSAVLDNQMRDQARLEKGKKVHVGFNDPPVKVTKDRAIRRVVYRAFSICRLADDPRKRE